jgi:hypothetical protein
LSTATPSRWADNPYALAELVLGEPIDWVRLAASGQRRALLADIFQLRDADALFRGAPDSNPVPTVLHLFRRVKYPAGGYATVAQAIEDARRQHPHVVTPLLDAFLRRPGAAEQLRRIVPWLVPIRDDADTDAPGAQQAADARPWRVTWRAESPGGTAFRLIDGSADFRDPMQGCIPDCSLLASISAFAWVDPADWQRRVQAASSPGRDDFTFRFFGPLQGTAQVSRKMPFSGRLVPYARSRIAAESWPTLCEKAYVARSHGASDEPTAQHYSQLGRESPHEVCEKLAPCRSDFEVSSPVFDHVRTHCTRPHAMGDGTASSIAKHPLMAWTFNESDGQSFVEAAAEFSVDSQLVENHAYTVLGWHRSTRGDWVLLRNPAGQSATDEKWLTGTWVTGRSDPGLDRVELNQHGVIGIPVDVFNRCFDGVAWAVPAD